MKRLLPTLGIICVSLFLILWLLKHPQENIARIDMGGLPFAPRSERTLPHSTQNMILRRMAKGIKSYPDAQRVIVMWHEMEPGYLEFNREPARIKTDNFNCPCTSGESLVQVIDQVIDTQSQRSPQDLGPFLQVISTYGCGPFTH